MATVTESQKTYTGRLQAKQNEYTWRPKGLLGTPVQFLINAII